MYSRIQQTFKKVDEGRETFEGIYEKLMQSTSQPQKDKLEETLKKEIKKLQRFRDQIKAWAAQNDVKDKKPLLDKRKEIETVCAMSSPLSDIAVSRKSWMLTTQCSAWKSSRPSRRR